MTCCCGQYAIQYSTLSFLDTEFKHSVTFRLLCFAQHSIPCDIKKTETETIPGIYFFFTRHTTLRNSAFK